MPLRRFSLQFKLSLATLLPLSAAILICWVSGVLILHTRILSQAQEKVSNDLNAAREIYNHEIDRVRSVIRLTAAAPSTADAFAADSSDALAPLFARLRPQEQLDILTAVDAAGTVLSRGSKGVRNTEKRATDPLIARALRGELAAGTVVLSHDQLLREDPQLARRAYVQQHTTPYAKQGDTMAGSSGMFLMAASPVRDRTGAIVGALYGGVLVNNGTALVDRIKSTLYETVSIGEANKGGSTIFLDDLRVATNVITPDNRRAIGTRLSAEVYRKVLLMKEKWVGRAFVVNDWYFAAYEPILSLEGVPIGALYVGMPEQPYDRLRMNMSLLYSSILLIGSLAGLGVARFFSTRLARPVKELESMARRVAAGELGITSQIQSADEIGELAAEFNQMSAALARQDAEIRELNRELEAKVLSRTAELEDQHRVLVRTKEELSRSEKLAAIGELAAGVAHEINNPMAIIRGNTELLQSDLPPDHPNREEVDIIANQVRRVERIVANLLKFARQEQRHLAAAGINGILDEIVAQIGHQVSLEGITVERRYDPSNPVLEGDADQLHQVFTNLVLNAIQAMPEGGVLSLATCLQPSGNLLSVTVADTGSGLPEEHLNQAFNPFFTTKPGGTGLGLAVSYGIVRDHGGTISVISPQGSGATFTVTLPLSQSATT
jgi:two-component system NtrC family sensor kinase